jgi:hypothetical protein
VVDSLNVLGLKMQMDFMILSNLSLCLSKNIPVQHPILDFPRKSGPRKRENPVHWREGR